MSTWGTALRTDVGDRRGGRRTCRVEGAGGAGVAGRWRPPLRAAEVQPGDPLAILYTSGTTGPAKGVICPHAQYFWWGVNSAAVLGVGADDVLCTTLPLFHINALNTLRAGRDHRLPTWCSRRASRLRVSGRLMRVRDATVVYLLGAMVPILACAARGRRVSAAIGCAWAWAWCARGTPMQSIFERTGVRLLEGYGSTETNFVIGTAPDSPRGGVMGWVRPGFEARVADDDDVGTAGRRGRRAATARERAVCLRERLLQNAGEDRGGLAQSAGFTPATAWCATPTVPSGLSTGIKDAIRRRGENISSLRGRAGAAEPSQCCVVWRCTRCARNWLRTRSWPRWSPRPGASAWRSAGTDELLRSRAAVFRGAPLCRFPRRDLPRTENGKVQKFKLRERGVDARNLGPGRRRQDIPSVMRRVRSDVSALESSSCIKTCQLSRVEQDLIPVVLSGAKDFTPATRPGPIVW